MLGVIPPPCGLVNIHMSDQAHPSQAHSVGFNLMAIAVVVALVALGAAYLIDAAGKAAKANGYRSDAETVLSRALGGHDLTIPRSWFRYDEQAAEGFAKQIDLKFQLPLGMHGKAEAVDVTLLPRSRVRPSAALLDGVYLHQFGDTQAEGGPVGLVGKPLKPSQGYEGEVVWYDALAADPFVAKCSKPVATEVGQCLRMVYLAEGIAAVYAFPETALVGWRSFDAEIGKRLRQIGAL